MFARGNERVLPEASTDSPCEGRPDVILWLNVCTTNKFILSVCAENTGVGSLIVLLVLFAWFLSAFSGQ